MLYSTVRVTSKGFTVGGLAGSNGGTLVSCYATGSVTGSTEVGGLVGRNDGTVASCHSTGSVTGSVEVGGLVGFNDPFGTLVCCNSSGSVTGTDWPLGSFGGLVGYNQGGTITLCYSTARVNGSEPIGGLFGSNADDTSQIPGSYYLAPSDGGGPDNGLGTALTANQMRQQGSFVGFDFWGSKTDGVSDDWWMPTDSSPVLVWRTEETGLRAIPDVRGLTPEEAKRVLEQAGLVVGTEVEIDHDRTVPQGLTLRTYPPSYVAPGGTVELVVSLGPYVYDWTTNPGNGTAIGPYEIQTASQLEALADSPWLWSRHFVVTADIDMAGRTYSTPRP